MSCWQGKSGALRMDNRKDCGFGCGPFCVRTDRAHRAQRMRKGVASNDAAGKGSGRAWLNRSCLGWPRPGVRARRVKRKGRRGKTAGRRAGQAHGLARRLPRTVTRGGRNAGSARNVCGLLARMHGQMHAGMLIFLFFRNFLRSAWKMKILAREAGRGPGRHPPPRARSVP